MSSDGSDVRFKFLGVTFVQCPLCLEQMDSDDISFFPCPCLYQVSSHVLMLIVRSAVSVGQKLLMKKMVYVQHADR